MMLRARDLLVVLPGDEGDIRVLDGVSLDVEALSITDIVGPSGSGKTTLLRGLARLLPFVHGSLELDGSPAETISGPAWRASVALLPQKPTLIEGSVRDNLLRPWTLRVRHGSQPPSDESLAAALGDVALDIALDRDISRLSVGQQARVALVRTTLTAPRVLLLDEPDAALDEVSSAAVTEMTRRFAQGGGAVVRVRHHRTDEIAHRQLRLEHGVLAQIPAVAL